MTSPTSPPAKSPVKIIPPVTQHLPAETFNWSQFHWGGLEVQMSLGVIDATAMREALQRAAGEQGAVEGSATYQPHATHRYLLSLQSFLQLKSGVDQLTQRLVTAGVLQVEAPKSITSTPPKP